MAFVFAPNEIPLRRAQSNAVPQVAEEESTLVRAFQSLISQALELAINNSNRGCLPTAVRYCRIHGDADNQRIGQAFNGNSLKSERRVPLGGSRVGAPVPIRASEVRSQQFFSRSLITER